MRATVTSIMSVMRSRDPLRWSLQEENLRETEAGKPFLEGLLFWIDTAEKMMDEESDLSPYDSVQRALVVTTENFGPLRTEAMADMLMLVVNFWEHGLELAQSMTHIETSMVHEAVIRATERLEESAQT